MNIATLFNAMPGALAQGLIWAIMAIGVYLTFRILDVADLTVDGTLGLGGAVCRQVFGFLRIVGIAADTDHAAACADGE